MTNPFLSLDSASRRQFLLNTAKTALGVSVLSHLDKVSAASEPCPSGVGGKAKSVIYLYMSGGMSHVDTWDPKTGETKGESDPISTTGGFQLSGYLPKMAKHGDKITIIRSMSAKSGVHEGGNYLMHTGYDPRGTIVHPSLGAWGQHFLGKGKGTLPSSVTIGAGAGHPGAGFFEPSLSPIPISNPLSGLQNAKATVGDDAFNKRVALMNEFDSTFRDKFKSSEVKDYTGFYNETLKLLKSEELKAFDISQESAEAKALYGATNFGQGALLARRLVQHGVRFVEVQFGGWDMHNNIDGAMKNTGAMMDTVFSTLIGDLKAQGLLDSTLVVMGSEFGRTPHINENKGRDHYPVAYSTVMSGGGVKGGYIHGSTDKDGKSVTDKQVTVQDYIATIGAAMGLPVEKVVFSPSGRPFTVGDKGKVIKEVFA
jgi:hypothetical protein